MLKLNGQNIDDRVIVGACEEALNGKSEKDSLSGRSFRSSNGEGLRYG